MLALLSPAKALDFTPAPIEIEATQPALLDQAQQLMRTCRGLSQKKIAELMQLSGDLAKLNYDRYRSFAVPFDTNNALACALAFNGDVYRGFSARTLTPSDLEYAQDHVGILSGMFGLLRPLDLIQPYRLEMGTRLKTRRGANLYQFWGERIAELIDERLAGHAQRVIVNLASQEYFKAVQAKKRKSRVVTCVFEDWKRDQDDGNVVGFLAKYARGLMARYMVERRVETIDGLLGFDHERYRLRPDRSTDDTLIFGREFIPVADQAQNPRPASPSAG